MERISSISNQFTSNNNSFTGIVASPPDSIFGVVAAFKSDKNVNKVNLSVGAYRDNNGNPIILRAVKEAERRILDNKSLNKEYLPIHGLTPFIEVAQKIIFGENSLPLKEGRIGSVQSLSGTGALYLCFKFIALHRPTNIYISNPTWGNHKALIAKAGLQHKLYPYWCPKAKGIDFAGMCNTLENAVSGSVILFHPCAHNPTGCDPTRDQWKTLAKIVQKNNLLPIFDSAYQGFASGDFENDAFSIRYFLSQGIKFFVCQSFSKNFGLYGERVGAFHAVTNSKEEAHAFFTQTKRIIRTTYSNPPKHGAFIVNTIVRDAGLYNMFLSQLKEISKRINSMRIALVNELTALNAPGDWSHITSQIGMFSYTGLTKPQVKRMSEKWHIYLLGSGRISMAGINTGNVKYIAQAITDCVRNT